jgi:hypothetical protein
LIGTDLVTVADPIAAHQAHALHRAQALQVHAIIHAQAARAHAQVLAIIHAQALVHVRKSYAHSIHANQHHAMYHASTNGTLVRT